MDQQQLIDKLDDSRRFFFKLVEGLSPEQWDAKPYAGVKSPKETLAHLIIDDRVLPAMLEGKEPDYAAFTPDENLSVDELRALLGNTHREKLEWLKGFLAGKDLDSEIESVYSGKQPLWWEVLSFATEDWYHIGQVSLVRQGTDPSWDYYAAFYGGE